MFWISGILHRRPFGPRASRRGNPPPRHIGLTVAVAAMACTCCVSAAMADCIDYGDYLHWVGSANTWLAAKGLTVSGTRAYVTEGFSGLRVIDITDPASPQIAGSVDTPGLAEGVAVSGSYAYVADGSSGLQVIDITNAQSARIVGSADTPGYAYGVAVSGSYAYVGDGAFLQVIDIASPASPRIVGSVAAPGGARSIAVSGAYAYAAGSALEVIDITNPASPRLVGRVLTGGSGYGLAVSGTRAYVAGGSSGLQVIEITNPRYPRIVGSVSLPGEVEHVAVSGTRAYVSNSEYEGYESGMQVIDIADPQSPRVLGSGFPAGGIRGVAVSGTHVFVAVWASGLHVIDIGNSQVPQIVGSVDTPGEAYAVVVSGTHAYVADAAVGLQVIDITNPRDPRIVGSLDTPGEVTGLAVSGTHAYVADGRSGLQVIDITNPQAPRIVGSVDTPGFACRVAISGSSAYVADAASGLLVIDVTNPESPVIVDSVATPGLAYGVAVSGSHAYVTVGGADGGSSSLDVVDITDSQRPQIVGRVDLPNNPDAVLVVGTHAYVADSGYKGSKFHVIDIEDPQNPQITGSANTPGIARGVAVSGAFAYVGDGSFLQVIDISVAQTPRLVGSATLPGTALGVAVSGAKVYVAAYKSGLQVLPMQCERGSVAVEVRSRDEIPAGRYVMMSLPVRLSPDSRLSTALSDLGPLGVHMWRGFGVSNNAYVEDPIIEPGQAFIVATTKAALPMFRGFSLADSFAIALQPGWNLVGCIGDGGNAYPWSECRVISGGVERPFSEQGDVGRAVLWYQDDTGDMRNNGLWKTISGESLFRLPPVQANPWGGYLLDARVPCSLVFRRQTGLMAATARPKTESPARNTAAEEWTIQLYAEANGTRDGWLELGVHNEATAGLDDHDVRKPPPLEDGVQFSVSRGDATGESPGAYLTDFRGPGEDSYAWDLTVGFVGSRKGDETARLIWQELDGVPAGWNVYLVTDDTRAVDMRVTGSYGLLLPAGESRRLSVRVSRDRWPGEIVETGVSRIVVLGPSPAAGEVNVGLRIGQAGLVDLSVFDVHGRVVERLLHEAREPGRYALTWSPGRSGVGSGVYFVRLRTALGEDARRVVVVRR